MNWVAGIQNAINYIENHIEEDLTYEAIAKEAFCSSYYFQKIFHILCGITLGEYIRNRRLSLAANRLIYSDEKIIDIALIYGYESSESFTRAFTRFHGATPSEIRKGIVKPKLYSRLSVQITMKGGNIMEQYKIVKKDAFKVLERVETHHIEDENHENKIPDFWDRAHQDGTVAKLLKLTNDRSFIFGICYGHNTSKDNYFDYAIATYYQEGTEVPEGFRISEIPARTWVIFDCVGPMPQAINDTFRMIVQEFFPSSSYEPTYEFDIEAYPAGNMTDENYQTQIWVSIKDN